MLVSNIAFLNSSSVLTVVLFVVLAANATMPFKAAIVFALAAEVELRADVATEVLVAIERLFVAAEAEIDSLAESWAALSLFTLPEVLT